MKKLNKTLSVLLTFVMLFTTFCFFPLDLGAVEANAAIDGIKIVVPETIYLEPSIDASTVGQYYVNNAADGSVITDAGVQAIVSVTGATVNSVSIKSSTDLTNWTAGTLSNTALPGNTTVTLGAGVNAGSSALVEWEFKLTVNGEARTHYAYSVAYSPYYAPIAASAGAASQNGSGSWAQAIAWVSGVHGYTPNPSGQYYTVPNNVSYDNEGEKTEQGNYYPKTSGNAFVPLIYGVGTAENNEKGPTNWFSSSSSSSTISDATVRYTKLESKSSNYGCLVSEVSPIANLTVDISRYTNLNQIPNLTVGFNLTDRENSDNEYWYVSDYTSIANNGNDAKSNYMYNYSKQESTSNIRDDYANNWYTNYCGSVISGSVSSESSYSTGVEYNSSWSRDLVTGSDMYSYVFKAGVYTYVDKSTDRVAYSLNYVQLQVKNADKSALRSNVIGGTSYSKENYTEASWSAYQTQLRSAAFKLGNPVNADVDYSALTTAENALKTNVYFNGNGGSVSAASAEMTIGGNATATFNAASYSASRVGYTFKGWATTANATTGATSLTLGFNQTLYAVWEANKYSVVFDNLININAWNTASASNGVISNVTDGGFTLTSNDSVSEATSTSHLFPVTAGKQYKMEFGTEGGAWDVYIFFYDDNTSSGLGIDFADSEKNRCSSAGVNPDRIFTAPTGATRAVIRVDANGANNAVTYTNIRVYEVGTVESGVSYEAPITVTYDSTYAALPVPSRTGYEFRGWFDKDGNQYVNSTKVAITDTLSLYSKWEIGTYTITFDTDGGNAINPITGTYGTAVAKPADPTKTGYLFTGWDKTVPDTIPGEDMTVKATWSENSYAVFFDGNGQTGGTAPSQINTTYTGAITLPECTYIKNGYTFMGWNTEADGTGVTYSAGQNVSKLTDVRDGGVTLYAVWEETPYTITYVYDNGTDETKVIPYNINDTLVSLAAPAKTGYTFDGWKVTSAEGNWEMGAVTTEGVTVDGGIMYGNVTLTAQWKVNQYTITFDTDGGSAVEAITQDYGTAVTAPEAPVKTGYTFAGWENLPETMPAENITVKAKWTINQYTVTFDTDGGSAVEAITQDYGTAVTAPEAPAKTGYTFAGWENLPETMPAENVTVKAKWTINQYTVTFDTDGGSTIETATYDFDAAITEPTAPVKTGYDFIGWSPDLPETMPAENITVKALWEIRKFDVTFKFFDKDGTEISVIRENIEYGTAFSELVLPTEDEGLAGTYYNAAVASPSENTCHYNFNGWAETVNEITADLIVEAQYTDEKHVYYAGSTAKAATCTETGIKAEYCLCGYEYEEVISALGHQWVETGRSVGCITDGTIEYKCSRANCSVSGGATKQETLKATGHVFSDVVAGKDPTCTEAGFEAYKTCTVCNLFFAEDAEVMAEGSSTKTEISAGGHTYGEWIEEISATCEGEGTLGHYTCSVCNVNFDENREVLESLVIEAKGHEYGEWTEEIPATCEGEGTLGHYTCSVCQTNFDENKAVLESLVIKAKGHEYGLLIAEVPATCVAAGTKAHYDCANCDKNFDENYDVLDSLVIETDPDNHDLVKVEAKAPACEEDGYKAYEYCQREGCTHSTYEVDAATGHNYEGKVTAAATCITDGVMTYTCKNDSTHTYDDVIKAEGHKFTDGVEYQAPDCENSGNEAYKSCSVCNKYFAASEDAFSANAKDSTDVFTLAATGHTEAKKQETITEASCTVPGDYWDITYCSVCDKELDRAEVTGQTLPHTYTEEVIDSSHLKSEATCTLYAVYYYDCAYCDANAKDAADNDAYTFEYVAGGYNAENHVGTTTTADEDITAGTCNSEKKWNEVTRCDDCKEIIASVPRTGEKDENNHVGETEIRKEDVKAGTCTTAETWNDVTYCLDCNNAINTEAKTGETNPANHSTDVTVLKDEKEATCCEKGYTGNMHCADCDAVVKYGEEIAENKENHVGGTGTEKEDVVAGTCMKEETWNDVTYCLGCGDKLKTEPVIGEKDSENHTGNNTVTKTDEIAGTCKTAATWTEVTTCECGKVIKTEAKTGEKDPENHTGNNTVTKTDEVAGTCKTAATWTEVTTCECGKEIKTEAKTGEKNPENHTGETNIKAENIVLGTCVSEKTWDEVTYCECGKKLSTVSKTGEKDENNHTGAADKTVGYIAPTCKNEGYTGDTYYSCCNKFYATGTAISTIDHTPDKAVKENEIPATETEDGSYDSVVYCSVCRHEISREKIITKVERTITFVMKDKTVTVKAYNGDTVALPDVADFVGADGFIHKFKSWDKPVAVVNGDAQYTAIYTEPADWSDLDRLEETLKEVLEGDYADDAVIEENKEKIEEVLGMIETINSERNTLDKDSQSRIDFVAGEIGGLIDIIYPDAGSTLVIEGSSVVYAGTILDLKAIKMPLGAVLTDAQWVSSDDNVVFFSNGKLYAIGTGTVTLTATRGILKASKTVTVIEGGNTRGINFTSINNTHFIIEDYAAVYNSAIIYWSDDFDLRFRVRVYQSFMFEDYIVYINGVEVEPNADGYYVVPAGSGDARVTIAGAMIDTGAGDGEVVTKWSFWEWLLSLFRKIADFFRGIFG